MTVSLDLLEAMSDAGLDDAAQLRLIRSLLVVRARRRAERAAARAQGQLASIALDQDSGGVNEQDSGGAFVAAADAPQRTGHVHNGNHKTVARAALLAHPALRPAARLVGAQLVERSNLDTGRCWPSIGRMARDTGLSARSVSRAVGELVAAGLVAVTVHGGVGHANSYRLDWDALGAVAAHQAAKMNDRDSGATRTLLSADQDTRVPEILSPNTEQKSVVGARRARTRRPMAPPERQLPLMVVHAGGKGDASYGRAGQRLWDDICRHGDAAVRRHLLDLTTADPRLMERATYAEIRHEGSGLGVLLAASLGQPPPTAATG